MIRLPTDKLKPGQILAQEVMRDDGVVLMAKGQELSESGISMLTRLDIESVVVEGDHFASEEERKAYLRQQEDDLQMRFSRVEQDPVLRAIREMIRTRLRER